MFLLRACIPSCSSEDVYHVTPLFSSSLASLISKSTHRTALSTNSARRLAHQLCLGVLYMHSANIVHRDLVRQSRPPARRAALIARMTAAVAAHAQKPGNLLIQEGTERSKKRLAVRAPARRCVCRPDAALTPP